MSDFQVTAAKIGMLTSIQFFIYTSLQIPMGILADRFGPNYLLIFGALLTGIGTIIYSIGTHEYVIFFARILTGTGDATIWVNMVLILGSWFKATEFVRLIGVAGMTGSLGFLLATVPFSALIDQLGWRTSFLWAGIVLCLCGCALYFVLLKKTKSLGLHEPKLETKDQQPEKLTALLRRIFSNRQAWALFFCHFGVVGGYVGFISSWAVPYGMNIYQLTRSDASQLIMIGLVGALIGAPLTSLISSKLGMLKKPYIVAHTMTLLSWSSFLFWKGHPPILLLTLLFFLIGFGYGASALTFAIARRSFSLKDSGIVSGFANTGGFLSAVLLPSAFGKVLDHFQFTYNSIHNGYFYGFIIPVLFSIIGLAGVLCISEKRKPIELEANQ